MLALCLVLLRGKSGKLILHNWSTSHLRFTEEFRELRAYQIDPKLRDADILVPHRLSAVARCLAVFPALAFFLLSLRRVVRLVGRLIPDDVEVLVTFCDAHLAGFVTSLAAKGVHAKTYTLHHGLYRADDKGSTMGVRNMVSDQILLWDRATLSEFELAGYEGDRLRIVGQYGFSDPDPNGVHDENLILLCPPYDPGKVTIFEGLQRLFPEATDTRWSLHPRLRPLYPAFKQAPLLTTTPKSKLAICGDSGVLMDALARSIPIITVSERRLGSAHLTYEQVSEVDSAALQKLTQLAIESLPEDRANFGFDLQGAAIETNKNQIPNL